MPFSVHAATSMWFAFLPVWLMSFSFGSRSITARGNGERCWVRITASASLSSCASRTGSFSVSW